MYAIIFLLIATIRCLSVVNGLSFLSYKHLNKIRFISYKHYNKEALAIRRIFSLVDTIKIAKFSNCPNDFKIRLFG